MQFPCSSVECSSFGTDCSSVDPSWAAVCARKPVPHWVPLHGLQLLSWAFSNVGSPWSSGEHHVPSWSPPQRNLYSSAWSNSSSFSHLGVSRTVSHSFFLFFSPTAAVQHFCPLLNLFSQRAHPLGWGAQLCPAVPSTGQPQLLLTEAALQPFPAAPRYLHLIPLWYLPVQNTFTPSLELFNHFSNTVYAIMLIFLLYRIHRSCQNFPFFITSWETHSSSISLNAFP